MVVPPLVSLRFGRALKTLIVPATSNRIASEPAEPLALRIAWRSDPTPLSASVVTANVAGMVRSSRRSVRRPARAAFALAGEAVSRIALRVRREDSHWFRALMAGRSPREQ